MNSVINLELVKAEEQVQSWQDHIKHMELSHDLYYTCGSYSEDKRELQYWERVVRELKK